MRSAILHQIWVVKSWCDQELGYRIAYEKWICKNATYMFTLGEKNVFVRNLFDKKLFINFPKLTLLEILYQYHEKYAL